MSYVWGRAYNPVTGERMDKPKWPSYEEYPHASEWYPAYYQYVSALKKWEAFIAEIPDTYRYERPKLRHATEKGVPVPNIRKGGRRKYKNGAGVSANSRVLSHRYADEGDKGPWHRREVRRKERIAWKREAQREMFDWFYYEAGWTPYDPEEAWESPEEDDYGPDWCYMCMRPCDLYEHH